MNKIDLWNTWKKYRDRIERMFIDDIVDLVQIRDMLACSCMCGDEPVEGVRTNNKDTMWSWLKELPGYHSDFKFIEDVKNNIGEGTGPFSEALMSVQRWNAEAWHDDAVMWTQKAYDMYVEHWEW